MNYNSQKALLLASENAYKKGELTAHQFLNILDDIENDVLNLDKKILSKDVDKIIAEYAKL